MFGLSLYSELLHGSAQRTWDCVARVVGVLWHRVLQGLGDINNVSLFLFLLCVVALRFLLLFFFVDFLNKHGRDRHAEKYLAEIFTHTISVLLWVIVGNLLLSISRCPAPEGDTIPDRGPGRIRPIANRSGARSSRASRVHHTTADLLGMFHSLLFYHSATGYNKLPTTNISFSPFLFRMIHVWKVQWLCRKSESMTKHFN